MQTIQKILVAVDFSEHSKRAFDWAAGFAKKFGAEIELLHCYELSPLIGSYGGTLPPDFHEELRRSAQLRLDELAKQADAMDVRVSAHLAAEHPAVAIAEHARENGADLIVMGTRGLSGIKHVLLGSVVDRTIQHAPCPVMAVPRAAAA